MDFTSYRNQVAAHFYLIDGESADAASYRPRADRFLRAVNELWSILDVFETVDIPDAELETRLQEQFYNVGKKFYGEDKPTLLLWFRDLYTLLRDQQQGPRIGAYVKILGIDFFLDLLRRNIENPFTAKYEMTILGLDDGFEAKFEGLQPTEPGVNFPIRGPKINDAPRISQTNTISAG